MHGSTLEGEGGRGMPKGRTKPSLPLERTAGEKDAAKASATTAASLGTGHESVTLLRKKEKDQLTQGSSGNTTKPENKPMGSANTVNAKDNEGDRFWMADKEMGPTHTESTVSDPPLRADSDDDLESTDIAIVLCKLNDWLEEEGEELQVMEEMVGATITEYVEADTVETATDTPHVKLYDSGATRHISPYKDDFSSYSPLSPPVYLNAVNQQGFPATGSSILTILVSNEVSSPHIGGSRLSHLVRRGDTMR